MIQERINELQEAIELLEYCKTPGVHYVFEDETFDLAISALKKQVPMKWVAGAIYQMVNYCPVCNAREPVQSVSFCPNCGQAIESGMDDD